MCCDIENISREVEKGWISLTLNKLFWLHEFLHVTTEGAIYISVDFRELIQNVPRESLFGR